MSEAWDVRPKDWGNASRAPNRSGSLLALLDQRLDIQSLLEFLGFLERRPAAKLPEVGHLWETVGPFLGPQNIDLLLLAEYLGAVKRFDDGLPVELTEGVDPEAP